LPFSTTQRRSAIFPQYSCNLMWWAANATAQWLDILAWSHNLPADPLPVRNYICKVHYDI